MAKENVNFLLKLGTIDAKRGLKELNRELGNTKMTVYDVGKAIKKSFTNTGIIGMVKGLKSLTEGMMKASEAEAEYIESMNLLAVSYRADTKEGKKLYDQTNDLLDSMNRYLGLDTSKLTQEVGIYKQMASAMGMTNETSALLSENLIKLQQDTASLYNLQSSEVATKFQSALAGQTRAVRSLGVDITQASLQQELYNLGIDKSINDLNRASKSVLIYLAMERQLTNANGDASRTINSMANQMKIFKEQVAIAGRQIGAVFIPILQRILPIANAILMVFNDIMDIILGLLGVDVQTLATEFGQKTYDIGDAFDDIALSADKATKSAKKLLGLRGFDKLNNITTPTDSGSTSGVSGLGNIGGVDKALLDKLNEYNLHLDDTKNKARQIADSIEDWLIYTDDTGKHLTPLGWTLVGIGGMYGLGKIVKSVKTVKDFTDGIFGKTKDVNKEVDTLNKSSIWGKIGKFVLGTAISVGGTTVMNGLVKDTREANKEFKSLYSNIGYWGSLTASIGGGALAGSAFGPVGALLGALAGGIGSASVQLYQGLKPLTTYKDELNQLNESTKNYTKTLSDEREEIIKNRDAQNQKSKTYEGLLYNLSLVVDENGKVKKGYEDEASYILGELNSAYGAHMTIQDGVIKNYETTIQKIQDQIDAEKGLNDLQAQEEIYNKEKDKAVELQQKLYYAQIEYDKTLREHNALADRQKEIEDRLAYIRNNNLSSSPKYRAEMVKLGEEYQKNQNELKKVDELLNTNKDTLDGLTNEYKQVTVDIDKYNKMLVASQKGDWKEVVRIAEEEGWNTAEAMRTSLKMQVDALKKGSPLTADIIAGYRTLAEDSKEEYAKGLSELPAQTALEIDRTIQKLETSDLADHFGKLSQESEDKFLYYLKQYPADVQTEIVDKMKEKGYEISDNLQKGIDEVHLQAKIGIQGPSPSEIENMFNNTAGQLLKRQFTFNSDGKLVLKANGGFVDEGQMFIAREAGPEMVGQINGRTAVANNDQIVQGITNGVMIGMARAMAGNENNSKVVIEAQGDTEGLLNFITFKQKEKNRQYEM